MGTEIVKRALIESLGKFDPRIQARNPVMFVVEVTALAVTLILLPKLVHWRGALIGFELQIALWLWFTVLFANFAEAMAEGRGKAQADNLRKTRTETQAKVLRAGKEEIVSCDFAAPRRRGDRARRRCHPRRWRGDRGCGGRQRGRDYRRIGAGDSARAAGIAAR